MTLFIHDISKTLLLRIQNKGLYYWCSSIKLLITLEIKFVVFKCLCSAKCKNSVPIYRPLIDSYHKPIRYIDLKVCHPMLRGPNCIQFSKSKPLKLTGVSIWCKLMQIPCFCQPFSCVSGFYTHVFSVHGSIDYWAIDTFYTVLQPQRIYLYSGMS